MKFLLELEYDGRNFAGWQNQLNQRTVQAEVERALEVLFHSECKKQKRIIENFRPILKSSGRTDTGVSAFAQMASLRWPAELPVDESRFLIALNGICPREIAIRKIRRVEESFDVRGSVERKQYSYRIVLAKGSPALKGQLAWLIPRDLDIPAMIRAARLLAGTHDFCSFRAGDCENPNTRRTILLSELVRTSSDTLLYVVQGRGFLKQMVRIIVGTLVAAGKSELGEQDILDMLSGKPRASWIPTAPARGLSLDWVKYRNLSL